MDDHTTPDPSAATLRVAVDRFLSSPAIAQVHGGQGVEPQLQEAGVGVDAGC